MDVGLHSSIEAQPGGYGTINKTPLWRTTTASAPSGATARVLIGAAVPAVIAEGCTPAVTGDVTRLSTGFISVAIAASALRIARHLHWALQRGRASNPNQPRQDALIPQRRSFEVLTCFGRQQITSVSPRSTLSATTSDFDTVARTSSA